MNETHVTLVGNVATQVDFKTSASGVPVARFRLATTVRRFDQQRNAWTDGHTSFYTVWAWRSLAANIASSVSLGEPVIVQGQLRIKESEREGRRYVSADLSASAVGHDLSRGTSAFARVATARPGLTESFPVGSAATAGTGADAGAGTGAASAAGPSTGANPVAETGRPALRPAVDAAVAGQGGVP